MQRLLAAVVLPLLLFTATPSPTSAIQLGATSIAAAGPIAAEPLPDYSLYLPTSATIGKPLRILVALHGTGETGPAFARQLSPTAEAMGWALLAPTVAYRDFRDPELVRRDGELLPRLKALIEALPSRTGFQFQHQVVLYGFSRGSQEAHRFSFMYPEMTLGVAGLSAGSYTLPRQTYRQNSVDQLLLYPFGTGDVEQISGRSFNADATRRVSYWIAVGARDDRAEDVPRQWDQFVGNNRVERAQRFVDALHQLGAQAELALFPGTGHETTKQMRDDGLRFLARLGA